MNITDKHAEYATKLTEKLLNMDQLITAANLSKYTMHYLPDPVNQCLYIMNLANDYIIGICYDGTYRGVSLVFDKDDGFGNSLTIDDHYNYDFLNDKFTLWKNDNFTGIFCDYLINEKQISRLLNALFCKDVAKLICHRTRERPEGSGPFHSRCSGVASAAFFQPKPAALF